MIAQRDENGLPFLTVVQAATELGVTEHWIRIALREGRLDSEKKNGKRRIYPEQLRKMINRHGRPEKSKKYGEGSKYSSRRL